MSDDDDKSLLERLLSRADYFAAGRWPATETLDGRAAEAIKRLTRERDEARAENARLRAAGEADEHRHIARTASGGRVD